MGAESRSPQKPWPEAMRIVLSVMMASRETGQRAERADMRAGIMQRREQSECECGARVFGRDDGVYESAGGRETRVELRVVIRANGVDLLLHRCVGLRLVLLELVELRSEERHDRRVTLHDTHAT